MSEIVDNAIEIKLEKNRIIIEQMNKKAVDVFDYVVGTREQHYNYACFEVLDKEFIRYFPFNKQKYLTYDEKLPVITKKSCIIPIENGMQALNKMLESRLWKVWGQDEEYILKSIKENVDE